MKTEKEIGKLLDEYKPLIGWVNGIIRNMVGEGIKGERNAGRDINMMINRVCRFSARAPVIVMYLKG